MIQTLSLQAAHEPFANGICPWRLDRRFQYFDPSASGNGRKETAVLLVPISNQVSGSLSPCGRFPQLLCHPGICWVPGHSGVGNTVTLQFNDDEDVELPEKQIVNNGEIAGPDVASMILEESSPGLTRFSAPLRHVSLDCSFTNFDAQLEQFAANAFRTPEAILVCHSSDDVNGFLSDARLQLPFPRLVSPVQAE